ncbi:membrane protein insertase YidC [Nocardioides sp. 1609]|uniref:membrane protein insertase YidC n=1 Tax=Nocardioides sp. 1609 TaxID=2508327 RepID=UPI0010701CA7|nr:membrane protein insertase YidC [Nocardioides sp. 1609]
MSVLEPVQHALAVVVSGAHAGLTALGAGPDAGATWVLSIAAVVLVVRCALLPLVVHGVRSAHATARARPALKALSARYQGQRDADSLRALTEERRAIAAEHGMSRLGCLPLLVQLPIWLGLYHLMSNVARGTAVGAMGSDLVSSLGHATLAGVPLADRGYAGAGPGHLAVVAGLALTAATLSFVTQRYLVAPTIVTADLPEAMATAQRMMPVLSAGGMLFAGGVVPVALLVYWVANSTWTLGQSAVVWRWFPTPGSPAALRKVEAAPV